MFQLTSYNIVQISSIIIYVILTALVLYSREARLKRLFSLFLAAAAGTSIFSLLVNTRLPYGQLLIWKTMALPFSTWLIIAYAHFIYAFLRQNTRKITRIGYGWVAIITIVAAFAYVSQGLLLIENELFSSYFGIISNIIVIVNGLIMVPLAFFLIKVIRKTADPEERNRTAYLLGGLAFMILAEISGYVFQNSNFAFSHIGYAGNAIVITYTLLRYRLLDIQLLLKKWMVYSLVTACITLSYLALLLVLSNLLRLLPSSLGIVTTVIMVVLFSCLFNWVKSAIDKGIDRLFYGSRYLHRKTLLDFAGKTSSFINIEEIANALLVPLIKVTKARQVSLMLLSDNYFFSRFSGMLSGEEPRVTLSLPRGGRLIRWLESSGATLSWSRFKNDPKFGELSQEEKADMEMSAVEILCPIICKQKLVGILALSKKQPRGYFTRDDIDMITTLAKESAVAIENAQIYSAAREKADTDELTGLRNHRYFQERLNLEIQKSIVSESDFSLLFIDLDYFKTYNDIYGHVLGDEILREFGRLIRNSIRSTDIGARYGGDEFAAVLLGTSIENAAAVAERIRQGLESSMGQKGITLTCSIGIASRRVDGILRGNIIQAADKALYSAKAAGRNRICLAGKLDSVETTQPEMTLKAGDNLAIDDIVHALATVVDTRDHYTFGHSKSVSRYATELAAAMNYKKEGIKRIRAASLLHDIGKLSIPDSILCKAGSLSESEWEMVKHHPERGIGILKYIVGLRSCTDAVLFHHERFDGKGYPKGLQGNNIPLDARILAIADSYDAMTSERSYKGKRLSQEEAIEEIKRCAGTQFDPELAEIFVNLRRKSSSLLSPIEENLLGEDEDIKVE